jgi:hypothetical protein
MLRLGTGLADFAFLSIGTSWQIMARECFTMNFHETFRTVPSGVLFASLLLFGDSSAAPEPDPHTWGETVGGLQMTVYLEQTTGAKPTQPTFRVELRNAGDNDLVVNLGTMLLAGPHRQYPDSIALILTDAQGKVRRFQASVGHIVGGRPYALIVPLPHGSTFSVPVDLHNYRMTDPVEFGYKFAPGSYSLEAQLTAGSTSEVSVDPAAVWTGSLTSNQLQFEVPRQ